MATISFIILYNIRTNGVGFVWGKNVVEMKYKINSDKYKMILDEEETITVNDGIFKKVNWFSYSETPYMKEKGKLWRY